ncbi:unnamed protein product [Blepharisma stoltei]|uniref:LAGLIDADG homing endonuclease n=1 Tax=Blepharisma stoltei TaxID=1481888 RepID=A0AAU9JNZ6_9CILI|nr:unnamed protein product [Blepharisma stoltei]
MSLDVEIKTYTGIKQNGTQKYFRFYNSSIKICFNVVALLKNKTDQWFFFKLNFTKIKHFMTDIINSWEIYDRRINYKLFYETSFKKRIAKNYKYLY